MASEKVPNRSAIGKVNSQFNPVKLSISGHAKTALPSQKLRQRGNSSCIACAVVPMGASPHGDDSTGNTAGIAALA